MTTTKAPAVGQGVKVLIGTYKGCIGKVVDSEWLGDKLKLSHLIEFASGYRVRYLTSELEVIRDL